MLPRRHTPSDDEVEAVYENVTRALHNTTKTRFTAILFNAKLGPKERSDSVIGSHSNGSRNPRCQMLVNFL